MVPGDDIVAVRANGGTMAESTAGPTESVGKALRLLALFRGADAPVRIAEASAATGLARSTTHRLLATLQAMDFVRQDRTTRAYFPGVALLALARSLSRDDAVREAARAEMAALVKRTGETANFIVLREGKAVFVEGLEGHHVLRIVARVGNEGAPHATAGGKVLLAAAGDDAVRRLYPKERLTAITSNTIVSRAKLLRHLTAVRAAGYATSSGESNLGVYAVAAAVRSGDGDVLGALSLAAPLARVTPASRALLALEVRRSAERLAGHFP
jgi:DNA-binding IclR family transcriptional regulator